MPLHLGRTFTARLKQVSVRSKTPSSLAWVAPTLPSATSMVGLTPRLPKRKSRRPVMSPCLDGKTASICPSLINVAATRKITTTTKSLYASTMLKQKVIPAELVRLSTTRASTASGKPLISCRNSTHVVVSVALYPRQHTCTLAHLHTCTLAHLHTCALAQLRLHARI